MRVLAAAALALLTPLAHAQSSTGAEREARHRAPTYGEATSRDTERTPTAPPRNAPSYGEATAGQRTPYRSERVVTRYYDGAEARQHVGRPDEPAPQWIRDEARAFRSVPQRRTARRADLDAVRYGDGSQYRGDVVRGLPHGRGTMQYGDGSSYEGTFRNGVSHGQGTYQAPSGDVLTGTFRDGVLADGEATYAAGHRYEGAFVGGRPHGQGVMAYGDGSSYEGAFQSGRPDGWGAYRDASGARFEGTWVRGHLDDGSGRVPESPSRPDADRERRPDVDRRDVKQRADPRQARDGAWQ